MKNECLKMRFSSGFSIWVWMIVMLFVSNVSVAWAQEESAPAEETVTEEVTDEVATEEPAEEESSMISPSVEFYSIQKSDNTIDLAVKLQAKVNGNFIKLKLLKVTFFNVGEESETKLGHLITDHQGKGVLNIKTDQLVANADGQITFKAVYAGNKAIESFEEEIYIQRGRLQMTAEVEDSIYTVHVVLHDLITGEEVPVPEATVGLFVKRSFRPLPVGEGTTDEMGEAIIEVPYGLPGDDKGNITLIARVDEHELFGNLEASVVKPWGKPVSAEFSAVPRALWSTRPPLWMLITFIVLITVVWGHYLVIIFELFRLRKEEKS